MANLIDWIEDQMAGDDEDRAKQSRKLRDLYEESAPTQRRLLDDALICICGYSFATALQDSSEDEDEQ